jgi:hypothetical protein
MPQTKTILFHGFAPQASPFKGGTMYVLPPFKRHRPVWPDVFGYKSVKVKIDPAWVGQEVYFQFWIHDWGTMNGTGLTNALEVLVHP